MQTLSLPDPILLPPGMLTIRVLVRYGWEEEVPGAPLFPAGMTVPSEAFSKAGIAHPSSWQHTGATPVLMTWTNGWATTFWEVANVSANATDQMLQFGKGGHQIGRGFHTPGTRLLSCLD